MVPMLNGIRLARKAGAKFLMTWHSDSSDFQRLVAGIPELFEGELVERFDEKTGYGTIIGIDDLRLSRATNEIEQLATPETADLWIADLLVKAKFSQHYDVNYKLERNFSSYAIAEGEKLRDVYKELSDIFHEIPKKKPVRLAIEKIDAALTEKVASALHVRRLHLMPETGLQINRFESFCDTAHCKNLIEDLLRTESDVVLVASDNFRVVEVLRETSPEKILALNSIIDINTLTAFQRALVDMYFLSKGNNIYGPRSAYGLIASIIGGGTLRNLPLEIARRSYGGADNTGAIAFWRYTFKKAGRIEYCGLAPKAGQSALAAKLSQALFWGERPADVSLEMALVGLAMRFCQYRHQTFFGDWHTFLTIAKSVASSARSNAILAVLDKLEQALTTRLRYDEAISQAQAIPDSRASRLLRLATIAVAMDCVADSVTAIDLFHRAEAIAREVGVNIRGLHMRVAAVFRSAKRTHEAYAALRAAVTADPSYADGHYLLGLTLEQDGVSGEGEAELRRAVELEPESGQYRFALGKNLQRAKRNDEALDCFREAVTCEPQNEGFAAELQSVLANGGAN